MKSKKINLSGKAWWIANQGKIEFANSTSLDKLEMNFRKKIKSFKKSIQEGGVKIAISTTKRSEKRAYVLHWAWKISKGLIAVDKVPAKNGVNIIWDHGSATASKKGAREIITAANVAYQPSLTSNHIKGKAIDWTITWTGTPTFKNKKNEDVEITSEPKHEGKGTTHNGNKNFHALGKTYGVIKASFIKIDGPHWLADGK